MSLNNDQEFEIINKKINSKIEIVFNKIKKCYEMKVVGGKASDDFLIKINRYASGTFNVERKPVFSFIDELNRKIGTIKIKNNDK
jgi:hypothetical protein